MTDFPHNDFPPGPEPGESFNDADASAPEPETVPEPETAAPEPETAKLFTPDEMRARHEAAGAPPPGSYQ